MKVIHTLDALYAYLHEAKKQDRRIGFVPTMGNLHAGHMRLVETARQRDDIVIVSIFVNPLQFGPTEDFDRYPQTLSEDCTKLETLKADVVFIPNMHIMYPYGLPLLSEIHVPSLGKYWCGASRPSFFKGVSTVVTKLFNMINPHHAYFGEKDFQQLRIIQTLVADLNIATIIVSVATERDTDGLALSSRNQYLSLQQRAIAPMLYATLQKVAERIRAGERDYAQCSAAAAAQLERSGFRTDYYGVARIFDLAPATATDQSLVVLAAAYLGDTRLIDNVIIGY